VDRQEFQLYLPVLCITACCHTMGPMGENQARRYVQKEFARCRYQLDVRQLQRLVEFMRMRHQGRSQLFTIDLFFTVRQLHRLPMGNGIADNADDYGKQN